MSRKLNLLFVLLIVLICLLTLMAAQIWKFF